jgi:hypothetical protein
MLIKLSLPHQEGSAHLLSQGVLWQIHMLIKFSLQKGSRITWSYLTGATGATCRSTYTAAYPCTWISSLAAEISFYCSLPKFTTRPSRPGRLLYCLSGVTFTKVYSVFLLKRDLAPPGHPDRGNCSAASTEYIIQRHIHVLGSPRWIQKFILLFL